MTTKIAGKTAGKVTGYHAHVYYEVDSKSRAAALRDAIAAAFTVRIGSWHDNPVGPHPTGSYQLAFSPAQFGELVPWLSLNRDGLVVFVHPETGDEIADHTDYALWMGAMPALDLEALG